jgi:hypothetical protein
LHSLQILGIEIIERETLHNCPIFNLNHAEGRFAVIEDEAYSLPNITYLSSKSRTSLVLKKDLYYSGLMILSPECGVPVIFQTLHFSWGHLLSFPSHDGTLCIKKSPVI